MTQDLPDITTIAKALTVPAKVQLLDQLMDHRGHTLLELAHAANIEPQTASYHLHEFLTAGWVRREQQGRFHYFFLVNADVAHLLEQFSPSAPQPQVKKLSQACGTEQMRIFRSCYDHMAGHVGVALTDALVTAKYLQPDTQKAYMVTPTGHHFFQDALAIDSTAVAKKKRQFAVQCLDWSERRHHLGGALGSALLQTFETRNYVERDPQRKRVLLLTDDGRTFLHQQLDMDFTS
ncbi:ArsR/SmtB family transcription factor [Schleiferilactobacillus perolens]|jgi:DNA-binding MarR family transcriptional regulator|uniref:ArsR/SmtB family transcription factor n=1 Tax=Schleiferilactobacillus perolens TaxID=100468 RepID=UPI0023526A5F|nr:helix-turn-helix transcriptional regulator [Schleiferilactobacillus perolens]MCI2171061.1 ArsR family transcriptional regulator [Schleiferilactobacillus perolens]